MCRQGVDKLVAARHASCLSGMLAQGIFTRLKVNASLSVHGLAILRVKCFLDAWITWTAVVPACEGPARHCRIAAKRPRITNGRTIGTLAYLMVHHIACNLTRDIVVPSPSLLRFVIRHLLVLQPYETTSLPLESPEEHLVPSYNGYRDILPRLYPLGWQINETISQLRQNLEEHLVPLGISCRA